MGTGNIQRRVSINEREWLEEASLRQCELREDLREGKERATSNRRLCQETIRARGAVSWCEYKEPSEYWGEMVSVTMEVLQAIVKTLAFLWVTQGMLEGLEKQSDIFSLNRLISFSGITLAAIWKIDHGGQGQKQRRGNFDN